MVPKSIHIGRDRQGVSGTRVFEGKSSLKRLIIIIEGTKNLIVKNGFSSEKTDFLGASERFFHRNHAE